MRARLSWAALARWALVACLLSLSVPVKAEAEDLRQGYDALREALRDSPFGRPLLIESQAEGNSLRGEVYAVLEHPFDTVRDALRQPSNWCDILILPFNVKYCHAVRSPSGPGLLVRIGRRWDQPMEDAFRLLFDFRNVAASDQYFESRLTAEEGPVSTRDYRIVVAAIPLAGGRTFLRLDYSYASGMIGRMAMQAYLATAGADKVGFTPVADGNGQPTLIGGVRGAVERNAMRYYLAVDAFLESLNVAPQARAEHRIQAWFDATERHPRQLREMDRETYVEMKRREVRRQREFLR